MKSKVREKRIISGIQMFRVGGLDLWQSVKSQGSRFCFTGEKRKLKRCYVFTSEKNKPKQKKMNINGQKAKA